jgi:hypothetical protein
MFNNQSSNLRVPINTRQAGSRAGDGTALGDAILQGMYLPEAGSEPIGYFNPDITPFRVLPDGKIVLLYAPEWDQTLKAIQAQLAKLRATGGIVNDQPFDDNILSQVAALAIAVKLGLSSFQEVLTAFQPMLENEIVGMFMAGTTMNHFLFKYTEGAIWFSEEVATEVVLNSLANLLLRDPEFITVHSPSEFEAKAVSLLETRKHEMRSPW